MTPSQWSAAAAFAIRTLVCANGTTLCAILAFPLHEAPLSTAVFWHGVGGGGLLFLLWAIAEGPLPLLGSTTDDR